jgi:7-cyano-7-deazaguanine synthase in queuosine biosynthesis
MILMLSGGLDSISTWRLLRLPTALNFDLGTKPQAKEQQALDWAQFRFGKRCLTRSLPMAEYEAENGYLAFRNPLMILAAAQIDPLVVIASISEWAPDKNFKFYRRLEKAVNVPGQLASFDKRLRISAPFSQLSKGELIALYDKTFGVGETRELLDRTWSCYGDGEVHCGTCGGCIQRWNAESHYNRLMGHTTRIFSTYETEPPYVLTPSLDKARWLRDNGWRGIQQIWKRRQQNLSAKRVHQASVPGLRPVLSLKQPSDQG